MCKLYIIQPVLQAQLRFIMGMALFLLPLSAATQKRLSGRDTIYISAVSLRSVWTQARSWVGLRINVV